MLYKRLGILNIDKATVYSYVQTTKMYAASSVSKCINKIFSYSIFRLNKPALHMLNITPLKETYGIMKPNNGTLHIMNFAQIVQLTPSSKV